MRSLNMLNIYVKGTRCWFGLLPDWITRVLFMA